MRPNLTAVSLCMYRVEKDGSFGYQPSNIGKSQEKFGVPRFKQTGVKQYPLIDANYPGGGAAMRKMWSTNVTRTAFIDSAIQKLKEQGLDGYNMDIEVSAQDRANSIVFIREFADGLHAVGAQLSVDIGNCPGPDSMGLTCEDYRSTPIDKVFTMSTYFWWPPPHHERPNTTTYAKDDINALGDVFGMGLATGRSSGLEPTDMANFRGTFDFIRDHPSIGTLGIWVNNPTPDYMAVVGEWLHPLANEAHEFRTIHI